MITYGSTTLTSYNTITKIEVYYYKSTSSTSLAGGSWSTTKPTWENGKYIWQKIRTTYEGKLENGLYYSESDPVNITGQQGQTGTAAYSYKLNASDTSITVSKDGTYSKTSVTFSATSKQGTDAVNPYKGWFKIETTANGTTWTTQYTSSTNESSKEYTIPTGILNIRCSLYQAGGTSVLLDIVSVAIVTDGKDGALYPNLTPFFSHDLSDVYNAETNPNGYWVEYSSYGWTKNSAYTFTQLEDGWLHVHVDNSSGTATIRNDCCIPRYNPSIKRATMYTFLVEFRNNQSTGAASGSDFYLVQQSGSVQFWGQNPTTAPAEKLEGIGWVTTQITDIPSDGSYVFSRFTKYSEPEIGSTSHWTAENDMMVTFVFRANAGAILDYDVRLSVYEGEYWGGYVPYIISDVTDIRKSAEDAHYKIDNLEIGGRNLIRDTADWNNCPYAGDTASINGEEFIAATTTSTTWRRINGWFTKTKEDIYYSPIIISFDVKKSDETPLSEIVFQLFTTNKAYKTQTSGNLPEGTRYYTHLSVNIWRNTENVNKDTWTRVYSIPIIMDEYFNTGSSYTEYDYLAFYIGVKAATGSASFRHMKIELGNKATDWTPAPEDTEANIQQVQTNLDNLEIGGRNLLLNTNSFNSHKYQNSSGGGIWTFSGGEATYIATAKSWARLDLSYNPDMPSVDTSSQPNMDLLGDTTITLSIEAKCEGECNGSLYLQPIIYGNNNNRKYYLLTNPTADCKNTFVLTENWQRYSVTLPADYTNTTYWTSDSTQLSYPNTGFGALIYWNSTGTVHVRKPKLERGQKATDWTPAPEDVEESIKTYAQSIQSQVDGMAEIHYGTAVPTLNNAPASTWTDTATKDMHVDDLYYNTSTGYCYRFTKSGSTYSWSRIKDSDITAAATAAGNAQTTANNANTLAGQKRRIFVSQPTPPYEVGDLWVEGSSGDIKKCKTARATGSYTASDWELASKYTDDTLANTANTKVDNLKKVRLGWRVNHDGFSTSNNGECYFHGYDSNNAPSDDNGVVDWNGVDLTITKGMWINPNSAVPYNTPILHVYRTSTSPYHSDVWWDDTLKKWRGYMYTTSKVPGTVTDWTWDETTDCILATYVEPASETAIQSAQLFNPPKKFSEISDPNTIKDAIDAVEVGGRNLFGLGSDCATSLSGMKVTNFSIVTEDGYKCAHATGALKTTAYLESNIPFTPKPLEKMVFSADIKIKDIVLGTTNPMCELYFSGQTINGAWRSQKVSNTYVDGELVATGNSKFHLILPSNEWHRVTVKWQFYDAEFTANMPPAIYLRDCTGELFVKNIKYERGTQETDWSLAPEDTNASIQQVQDNLDNLEIGGRNLLLNTGGNDATKVTTISSSRTSIYNINYSMTNGEIHLTSVATTAERYYRFVVPTKGNLWGVEPGETYTISFYTKGTINTDDDVSYRSQYTIGTGNWVTISDNRFKEKVGTDYQKVFFTETIPSNASSYYFSIQVYGSNASDFYIKNLKFEKGGKATDWTPAPEDTQADIDTALAQSVEYIIGTQTAATGNWTGVSSSLTELKDGTQIRYWLPYAGSGNATLNLTLKDGTATGAIPVYRQGGSASSAGVVTANRVTTHFPAGTSISMVYGVNRIVSAVYSGTTYTGTFTGWFADGAYDSGNTVNRTRLQNAITAETAITAAHIICGTATGYKNIGAGINFDLSYPILYAGSAIAATKTGDNNYLQINGISASNNGTITSGVAKKVLYLKGTVSGNIFTISASPFMTTVTPTSTDGFYYIPLGMMYSATAIYFTSSNRLYAYIDGAFQPVDTAAVLRAQDAKDRATAVYGTCSTGATTVDKVVTCPNFTLFDGARIQITFTNANTAIASETTTASPTLNINGTGRKPIKIGTEEANTANPLYWAANAIIEFVYDGSAWVLQNAPYTLYGTCDTEENVREKQVVCDGAVVCKGTTIYVDMLYSNTADSNSENGNVTLNVANTIAKTIYANNATLTIRSRYNWNAGENPSFTFDGQYWQMDKDTVPAYITDKDEDGIFVHPINDTASGWSIGKVFELLNNGYSYIKMWLEDVTDNLSAKIRIGREDQHHILLDKEIIKFKKGDTSEELASFSSSGISFDDGVPFKIGNDSTYVQFVDNNSDGVADALEIVADKISFKNGGDNTVQDIQEKFDNLQTDISNITNNIEINPTADTPYVAITTQKNEYNAGLKLEPTQLSFQLNGQTTATIANDKMNIPTASVTNLFMQSANQSYEKIWVMRSNGHLSLKVGKQN